MIFPRLFALAALLAACSSNDTTPPDVADAACVGGPVELSVETPSSYVCHDPFKAKIQVKNGSCSAVAIRNITVVGSLTAGTCPAPSPASYEPAVSTVAAGATVTILDLAGDPFCCAKPACPATLACDEAFDFTVATADAPLNTHAMAHVELGGCDTVCK